MKKDSGSYLDPALVGKIVCEKLANQDDVYSSFRLQETPLVLQKDWSTLYFINLANHEKRLKLVAKISCFPDQLSPETSWQSRELLTRGKEEFQAITCVYDHFSSNRRRSFSAIQPHAYIPQINAVVMDWVSGKTLYKKCFSICLLSSRRGVRQAEQLFFLTGQWLRKFHEISMINKPSNELIAQSDPVDKLIERVDDLKNCGVIPFSPDLLEKIISILRRVNIGHRRWIHSDFHLQNVLVLSNGKVLAIDTAMSMFDSPLYDLGKFLANLKTRRRIVQSFGIFPSPRIIKGFETAFLRGYFGQEKVPVVLLALYEGQFIFLKWKEYVDIVHETFISSHLRVGTKLGEKMVSITFNRITKEWVNKLLAGVNKHVR